MTAEGLVEQIIDFLSAGSWYVLGALVFVLFIALIDGMRTKSSNPGEPKKPFSGDGGSGDGDGDGDL